MCFYTEMRLFLISVIKGAKRMVLPLFLMRIIWGPMYDACFGHLM